MTPLPRPRSLRICPRDNPAPGDIVEAVEQRPAGSPSCTPSGYRDRGNVRRPAIRESQRSDPRRATAEGHDNFVPFCDCIDQGRDEVGVEVLSAEGTFLRSSFQRRRSVVAFLEIA
jgi:hypothetical protein